MKQIRKSSLHFLAFWVLLVFPNALNAQEVKSRNLSRSIKVDALLYHKSGSIFASGGWNGANLYKIDQDGSVSVYASGFTGIVDMVWGENDTIIGSSYQTGQLIKIAPNGTKKVFIQASTGIASLYKDFNGDIICTINPGLAHPSPGEVIKVEPDGTISRFASGGSIMKPSGVTQDEEGNYYISNLGDGKITKVKADGSQELFATIPATGQWKIGYIKFWKGALYTSAISQNKIYKTALNGRVGVYAGDGISINKDGIIPEVSFRQPNGMVVSGDTLFVISGIDAADKIRYVMEASTSIENHPSMLPSNPKLEANFPNPFYPSTKIEYVLSGHAFVSLRIFDSLGALVKTIVSKDQQAGNYIVEWDGKDSKGNPMAPGIYVYELSTGGYRTSKKMLLMKK